MIRREKLNDIAVTMEERQTYISQATNAEAAYQTALANLDLARINFKRTAVRSPVNGYITNLTAQLGDYANVGDLQLSVVNADFILGRRLFRGDGAGPHPEGDVATIKLMGYTPPAARQSSGARARHQRPECGARRFRACLRQSDLHLRAPRSARAGAHSHR